MDDKLDPRARKVIFLGLKAGVKGYKLWHLSLKKIVISRDATFNEVSLMKPKDQQKIFLKPMENTTVVKKTPVTVAQVETNSRDENGELEALSYSKLMI